MSFIIIFFVSDPTRKILQKIESDDRSKNSENNTIEDVEQKPLSNTEVKTEYTGLPSITEEIEFNDSSSSDGESVKEELARYMSENSELTQEQILTVIKQQNKNTIFKTHRIEEIDINAPSSSKQGHSYQHEMESEENECVEETEQTTKLDKKPIKVDTSDIDNTIMSDTDMSENCELSQEQIFMIIKEQNKCLYSDKMESDAKQSSGKNQYSSSTMTSIDEHIVTKSRESVLDVNVNKSQVKKSLNEVVRSSFQSKSSKIVKDDIVDIKQDLPCQIEKVGFNSSIDTKNDCEKLNIECVDNIESIQPELISTSESDDDFVAIPSSPHRTVSKKSINNGHQKTSLKSGSGNKEVVGVISSDSDDFEINEENLTSRHQKNIISDCNKNENSTLFQITIQTNTECKVEDDIFADIFLCEEKSKEQLSTKNNIANIVNENKNHKCKTMGFQYDNTTDVAKEVKTIVTEEIMIETEESRSGTKGKRSEEIAGNYNSIDKKSSAVYSVPEMGKSKYFPKSKNEFEGDKVLEKIVKGEENVKEQDSDSDIDSLDIPKALSQKTNKESISKKLASKDLKKLQVCIRKGLLCVCMCMHALHICVFCMLKWK